MTFTIKLPEERIRTRWEDRDVSPEERLLELKALQPKPRRPLILGDAGALELSRHSTSLFLVGRLITFHSGLVHQEQVSAYRIDDRRFTEWFDVDLDEDSFRFNTCTHLRHRGTAMTTKVLFTTRLDVVLDAFCWIEPIVK